ncbi:fibronectin type III domain-containing protein [Geomesophilobacter sediminis]|uniref:Fibronectin type III domain-containing protein n=1 Tax=Geomesophilobacter sediminis TaxID=2798584 RepID=A0A8J7M065_9BACT|nr:fibronectin type III domain-containing protein [Geomesophilobacter sediminis]MBJ6723567.1 fibronectin type III domain-containing protein [Geomesophilobacter sediminis]
MEKRLITAFNKLGHGEFLLKARPTVEALTETGILGFTWAFFLATPDALRESFQQLEQTHAASLRGDPVKTVETNTRRHEFNSMFGDVLDFVSIAARKDSTLLIRAGLGWIKKTTTSPQARALSLSTGPKNFTVKHGTEHGVIIGRCSRIPGAKSYEVWWAEDPNNEENWKYLVVSSRCNRIEMRNLTPGRLYWFRVRAILSNGTSPWSALISLMAI